MGRKGLPRFGIGEKIQRARGTLTLEAFAIKSEIPAPMLSQYETGRKAPGHRNLAKIARAGGVSVDWILGLSVAEQPQSYAKPEEARTGLDRIDQKTLEEIEELLRDADEDVKRHLRDEVKLLKRVPGAKKKRISGED